MIRHARKLLITAVLFGISSVFVIPAEAGCHGNSGGRSYGSSYSHGYSQSYSNYSQPIYQQPVYPQQVYQQPAFPQPQYSPQVYGQQVPVYGQQPQAYGQQPQVYGQQPQQLNGQQPQVYGQPQTRPQQVQSGYPGTATAPQQGLGVNIQGGNSGNPQFAQISGQNAQQGANPQSGLPQGNSQQNSGPPIAAAGPVAPGVAQAGSPAPLNSSNMSAATADAQQSALQALGGFAPPQPAAAQSATITPADQGSVLSGNFTASLSNGARVELSLQADGRFNWVAVNSAGQSSNFQGTYRMDNASLSLSRSNDGQTLSGSLTTNGPNSFGFKLADANSSSLNFVRN